MIVPFLLRVFCFLSKVLLIVRCKSHEFEFPIGCGYVVGAIGDFHIVLFSLPTGITLEISVIGI